jgi:hypothetical protein
MSLTNSISIKRRFLRSINIVKDHDSTKGIEGYVVTPLAQQALDQISDGFREGVSADRAFTLTGPYGSGKSSFALFLYYLLSDSKHQAWDKLREVNKKLASSLHLSVFGPRGTELGFIVLPITSRRTSVTTLLSESLEDVPDRLKNALLQDIEGLRDCADSKTAIRLVQHAAKTVVAKGYKGLFFIFDEFGKVFEEAYYNRKNTDIFVLQELAEAASRSKDAPLLILGMLHQAFGNYVDDIHDSKTKAEFSKIEGRFQPISFVETPAAQIQLLANAFERTDPKEAATPAFRKIVNEAANDDLKLHAVAGISATDFATFAKAVYPFHPLAMIALPLLFRRFGQNERSIFTYLVSNEPLGFKAFLSTAGEHQLLRLTDLYDYLLGNHETHLSRHPQGKVFLEANDLINSKPSLSLVDREILKIVAVLTALGMQSHLKASEAMIRYAVSTPFAHTVLERLMSQSVLVYRKFNGTYAIWEGSDVDLLACGEKADRALGQSGFAMAATLKKYLHPKPVIAKRHSFRTGSLRYFDVEYVDSPDSLAETLSNSSASRAVGRILVCLAQSASVLDTFSSEAVKLTSEDTSLLFAIPKSIAELKEALREVQRLKWIEENIKELRDDRVARREIAMRLADANQRVIQQQITLLDPRPDPYGSSCQWIWHGEVKTGIASSKDVSVLLSAVCDALFKKSPQIRNEMICKREPSSQAAAARNILIKFVTHPECVQKPFFGIEGFPPERSIYDCLFRASGIHREVDGSWILSAPDRQHTAANLYPCWEKMDLAIFAATDKPLPLNELYEKLRNPPYGLLDGIHPVLLTAFYVLNRNEVTLYFEDTYLPDPQDANFELLVRRPDLFAIAGARIAGMRLKIIKRLADGLKVEPYVSPVVRHLYKWYRSLPRYAQNTNLIPKEVLEFRKSLADAKSPEKLLFVDLPQVFGLSPITEKAGDAKSFDLYFEKLNQCIGSLSVLLPNLIKEQRKLLLDVCRLPNSKDGWNTLYERACFLAPRINNSELMPFLQTIITTTGDWNKAETVMGFMVSSPMANWGTLELQKYPDLAKGKAELFLDAYAPFSKSVASLSRAEQQQVDSLSEKLQKSFPNNSVNPLVTRAALLACLAALDKETK